MTSKKKWILIEIIAVGMSLLMISNIISAQEKLAEEGFQKECVEVVYTAPKVTSTPDYVFYDIPVSEELQIYINDLSYLYKVEEDLIYGVMKQESNFIGGLKSKTNDYGLMQINKINHKWLANELGIKDFLNDYDSVRSGIYMLSNLTSKYSDIHQVLMSYNCGEAGARRLWKQGIYSTKYSRSVIKNMEELRYREE